MLSSKEISMLIEATGTSVYMTLASTLMAYVIGLPIGILLVVCAPGGLKPKAVLYKILDFIVNITRSIPFLILMLLATPLARLVTGKSYGANATIISLTLAAAPFIARLVESSLLEVDKGVIEAAQSMGASIWQIVFKVLIGEARVSLIVGSTIALGTVLGYTAMSGAIGGGGLARSGKAPALPPLPYRAWKAYAAALPPYEIPGNSPVVESGCAQAPPDLNLSAPRKIPQPAFYALPPGFDDRLLH